MALLLGFSLGYYLTGHYNELAYTSPSSNRIPRRADEKINLFFSPKGRCAEHLIKTIHKAEKSIYTSIYVFTHKGIANAMKAAKARGVDIHILADNTQANSSYAQLRDLNAHGIAVYIDKRPGVFHHKWSVIDRKIIVNGSYNYTKNAEDKNNEMLGHIASPKVAEKFYQYWLEQSKHPQVYPFGKLFP